MVRRTANCMRRALRWPRAARLADRARRLASIYRSVRLRRGFNNIQTVHGIQTLRIPQLLLNEKQRTQARFEVCDARAPPPPRI